MFLIDFFAELKWLVEVHVLWIDKGFIFSSSLYILLLIATEEIEKALDRNEFRFLIKKNLKITFH